MKEAGNVIELADRLFDGLVEVDIRGRITLWNGAAERITGYAAAEVLGKQYQQQPARHVSAGGNDLPDGLIPVLMTAQDGIPREALAYQNHADGYCLTTITRTEPLRGKDRNICGGLEIFNDNKAMIASFQTVQKTEETILFDPLTGIGNRPHIEAKIRSAIEDFRVRKCPFGILFIDVDNFKDFNDEYGHLLGDKVLRMAANTLRQNLRMTDSCGRWGGEEFIALVYDLDSSGLAKVAEKLRYAVSQRKIQERDLELGVTISIGSTLMRPVDTFEALVERADQLMYESKRQGRNRVTIGD